MTRITKRLIKSKSGSYGSSGSSSIIPQEDAEAIQVLSDFVLIDRFGWTPRDIETLTEFEYDSILSIIDTLSAMEKAEREKKTTKSPQNR